MSDEHEQGQKPATIPDEQVVRTAAAREAGSILRSTGTQNPLIIGSKSPGSVMDIIDLAEWIVSGEVYSVKTARDDHEDHVRHIMSVTGVPEAVAHMVVGFPQPEDFNDPNQSDDSDTD